eukprot:1160056-Pelagomonas_calceolata.AAC.7
MVRREVVAEVVASTRNMAASLTGEMAAMLQEVGCCTREARGVRHEPSNNLCRWCKVLAGPDSCPS